MVKKLCFIVLITTTLSFAQNNSYDFKNAELKTRDLIYKSPDSALIIIKRTLSQKGNVHDTIKGNTYNLYGLYYAMKGMSDSSLYYFNKSLGYLNDYPEIGVRSLMNIAISYRKKGDYKTSIKYLKEVLAINKKIKNEVGIAMVYGELASNYNSMFEYNKSVDYLIKSIKILTKEKNSSTHLYAIKQKLANTYLAMENFEFALDIYEECLEGFKSIGMDKNYYLTHINIGEAYIRLNKFTEASKALKIAVNGLEKFGDKELLGITYSKIGNIQNIEGQNIKASASYQKALDYLIEIESTRIIRIAGEYINVLNESGNYSKATEVISIVEPYRENIYANIQDRMVYEKAIAETFEKTDNSKKAITAYKETIVLMDSISSAEAKEAVKEVQAKFQTELQREKNMALEAKNKALTKTMKSEEELLFLYIAGSIAIIILILLFLRGYWLKLKLQKEETKFVEAEKSLIEQKHAHELELNNTQKEVIEEKQRELTSTALRMANYQDNLDRIIEKCEAGEFTKVTEVKKELQLLIKQKDYWKQFETRFNTIHPDFNSSLVSRFPKLTKNDVEFCSLLKLNLSNKEIASLLKISHESTITKKYRIKKKMGINDDAEFERVLTEV